MGASRKSRGTLAYRYPVFRDTLTDWILADGTTQPMTDAERLRVLDNIGQGLAFMGGGFEWVDGPSP